MNVDSLQIASLSTGRVIACLSFLMLAIAFASATEPYTPDEIVTKLLSSNAARASELRGYTCNRTYEVDYKGFPTGHKHAVMQVRVTYQSPYKKDFEIISENGSKLLLNHVLHRLLETEKEINNERTHAESDLSRENYDFEFLGKEVDQGKEYYTFHVKPRRDNKLLFVGKIWVDPDDFAVSRIEAQPAKAPSVWISHTEIEHRYARIGKFWMPVQNRSVSKVRFGGKALLTVDYRDYALYGAGDHGTEPFARMGAQ